MTYLLWFAPRFEAELSANVLVNVTCLRCGHLRCDRLFVATAILILIGLGIRTVPTTTALAAVAGVDPSGMMITAKDLTASHYDSYSVVFN